MNKYKNKSNICGKLIQEYRINKNISLEKLSNKLQLLDIVLYPNDIFLIEKHERIIKDFELLGICEILNIDIREFKQLL